MNRSQKCPVCGNDAVLHLNYSKNLVFCECPICGRYELQATGAASKFDLNHLASYFVYHYFSNMNATVIEYRYHTVLEKDDFIRLFKNGAMFFCGTLSRADIRLSIPFTSTLGA